MGRCKSLARNLAKRGFKTTKKTIKKHFKRRKIVDDVIEMQIEALQLDQTEKVTKEVVEDRSCLQVDSSQRQEIDVEQRKLCRNALPLLSRTKYKKTNTKKVSKNTVVAVRRMSKKKARKLLKELRRDKKQKQRLQSMMDTN